MLDSKDFIDVYCYASKYDENRNTCFVKDNGITSIKKDDIMSINHFIGLVKDETSGDLHETNMVKLYMSSSFVFYAMDDDQFGTHYYSMLDKILGFIGIK